MLTRISNWIFSRPAAIREYHSHNRLYLRFLLAYLLTHWAGGATADYGFFVGLIFGIPAAFLLLGSKIQSFPHKDVADFFTNARATALPPPVGKGARHD